MTPTLDTLRAELRRLAEAVPKEHFAVFSSGVDTRLTAFWREASPATILALLDHLDALERDARKLESGEVQWIVNDLAELGVLINGQAFFLYKGRSLVYEDATHDDGRPMKFRPVFKREFGECCHPINYSDPTKIGTVSLDDDDEWQDLPTAALAEQGEPK